MFSKMFLPHFILSVSKFVGFKNASFTKQHLKLMLFVIFLTEYFIQDTFCVIAKILIKNTVTYLVFSFMLYDK